MEHIYRSRRERLQYIVPEEGREEPRHIIIALIYERSAKEKRERVRTTTANPDIKRWGRGAEFRFPPQGERRASGKKFFAQCALVRKRKGRRGIWGRGARQ